MKVKAALKEQAKSLLVPVLFLLAIGIVALTVSLIPEDACYLTILPDVMRIREHVHIRAAGNIPSWRKRDQTSICQFMRMSVELIFLTPKIFV